jgi:hypothetical protein
MLRMVEAMARSSGSTSRSLTNERSILSLPTGMLSKKVLFSYVYGLYEGASSAGLQLYF